MNQSSTPSVVRQLPALEPALTTGLVQFGAEPPGVYLSPAQALRLSILIDVIITDPTHEATIEQLEVYAGLLARVQPDALTVASQNPDPKS